MGPQLYRCGDLLRTSFTLNLELLLQWGRNFIVAETPITSNSITTTPVLQWGRNFIVAETEALISQRPEPVLTLQWGRNFIVAETVPTLA